MKKITTFFITILLLASFAEGSSIKRASLSQIGEDTKYVVLGYVEEIIHSDEESDTVKIKVIEILKGEFHSTGFIEIRLRNKGVKDFDPVLKEGDQAVFLLSEVIGVKGKLTYWGSIATFPEKNFENR